MFDFSSALVQMQAFISAALGVIDPSTALGGLVLVALGVIVLFSILSKIKNIIPS